MSYQLARSNPAEYARLQTDLTTRGTATLANNATITPPADAWAQDSSNRSTGERLLQSSLMDYARPGQGYNNAFNPPRTVGTPPNQWQSQDGWNDRQDSGLVANEEDRVLGALYNRNCRQGNYNDLQTAVQNGRTPVMIDMNWGTGGHAVQVTRIENGRVYFRNPWGGNAVGPNGQVNAGPPPRRTENTHQAEESMTVADFQAALRQAHLPQD